jgi:5-methylthioadenosine/S-adenosylhomocysteine deaminase
MKLYLRKLALVSLCLGPLCCRAQQTPPYALRGTLVMPDRIVEDGIVLVRDGVIAASGEHVSLPSDVPVIDTQGIIAPGFIDLHNHLTWNVFPRWKPSQEFGDRYDWQQKAVYQTTVAGPHDALAAGGYECQMERYAELKAITEGETSVAGSLQQPCSEGLARNLDLNAAIPSDGPPTQRVVYNVFPLQMAEEQLAIVRMQLAEKTIAAFLIHLAEGAPNDASASREFTQLRGRGLLLPGVSLIHGVGLKPADFAEMAKQHVGLIWSPRSNIELYGDTANVAAALAAGVTIAIAPDWSITGSDGILAELTYASLWSQSHGHLFSDRDLVRMATVNAAALAGNSGRLGSLEPGHIADLLVISREIPGATPAPQRHDAWWTLTHASPAQVELVAVAGQPVYGDSKYLLDRSTHQVETLSICGVDKGLLLTGAHGRADAAGETWAATSLSLANAMQHYGRRLAPLSECGN